ncbi:MAG TPA: flavodoxin family protein [Clostridiales bacterium]|nr:flavodoxin family protein [Clostridiales bacterium]
MSTVSIPSSKNTLVIFGSPHRNGFTAKLLNQFLQKQNITRYSIFYCYDEAPMPCNDCGACKLQSGCVLPDLKGFYQQFEQSDIVIFATPVYNASFPAPLKSLIDRLQVYYNARFFRGLRPPISKPKQVFILLTCGKATDPTELILAQIKPVFTVTNCKLSATVCMAGTDSGEFKYYEH